LERHEVCNPLRWGDLLLRFHELVIIRLVIVVSTFFLPLGAFAGSSSRSVQRQPGFESLNVPQHGIVVRDNRWYSRDAKGAVIWGPVEYKKIRGAGRAPANIPSTQNLFDSVARRAGAQIRCGADGCGSGAGGGGSSGVGEAGGPGAASFAGLGNSQGGGIGSMGGSSGGNSGEQRAGSGGSGGSGGGSGGNSSSGGGGGGSCAPNNLEQYIGHLKMNGAQCTSFKVGSDLLMTNFHCLAEGAEHDKVSQDAEKYKGKSINGFKAEFKVNGKNVSANCTKSITGSPTDAAGAPQDGGGQQKGGSSSSGTGARHDFALLQCSGLDDVPSLPVATDTPKKNDKMTIAAYDPDGQGQHSGPRVASGEVVEERPNKQFQVSENVSARPGNSGSMMVNSKGEIAGLVFASTMDKGDHGSAIFNSFSEIMKDIQKDAPESHSKITQNTKKAYADCNGGGGGESRESSSGNSGGKSSNGQK
jgi:hypothetical protein